MIRTLIVDDEPIARAGLRRMLGDDADLAVAGECSNGAEAVAFLQRHAVDLLLLDVQMPVLDGLGVLAALAASPPPDGMPVTLLLTAHDSYAVQAYEAQVLDYVVKPFSEQRLAQAIARAKRTILERRIAAAAAGLAASRSAELPAASAEGYATRILVPTTNGSRLLAVCDIDWIEAADYCVRVRAGDHTYVVRGTLDSFEGRLDPRQFVRSHRSVIVNLDRIQEIQPDFHGKHVLLVRGGARLPLSRARRAGIERLLGGSF